MSLLGIIYSPRKNVSHVAERCFFVDTFYITRAGDKKLARNDNLPKVWKKFRNLKISSRLRLKENLPEIFAAKLFLIRFILFLDFDRLSLVVKINALALGTVFVVDVPFCGFAFWVQRNFD